MQTLTQRRSVPVDAAKTAAIFGTLLIHASAAGGFAGAPGSFGWTSALFWNCLLRSAVPVFFLAFLLKFVFAVELGVLPASGRQDTGIDATHVTGFYILDGLLTREWDAAWNAFVHLVLPAVALSTIPFAVIFRITRAAVLDVVEEDYVRTARAKGLAAMVIRRRHILHNAMLPVVTTIGLQTGALLAGAVLTERVFNISGIGQAVALGFQRKDYPVLQVVVLAAAGVYVLVNLVVDLSYALIDPRLRTR